MAAHAAADAAEDELFGAGRRGDEVPPEAWSPRRRDERIAAALAGLEAEREAAEEAEAARAEAFRAAAGGRAADRVPPASAAVELAEENLARVRAARAAQLAELEARYAAGQPRRGRAARRTRRGPMTTAGSSEAAGQGGGGEGPGRRGGAQGRRAEANRKGPGPVRNITDPDSRLMPVRGGGFIQGYNTQNMTSEDGLIIATELTDDPADCAWFEPMLAKAQEAAALIAAHRPAASPARTRRPGPAAAGRRHRAGRWPMPGTAPSTT